MQHNIRDPSRDRTHGRVYRVTYEGRPLSPRVWIAGQPIEALLDRLKETEDRVRYRAKVELSSRPTRDVLAAVKAWVAKLDKADAEHEHDLTEALWVHQYHDVVDLELLDRVLASPDFRARAAATRVLCAWRDRVPRPSRSSRSWQPTLTPGSGSRPSGPPASSRPPRPSKSH